MLAAALAALLVGAPAASYDLSLRSETRRSRLDPAEARLEPEDRTAEELSATLGFLLDAASWGLRLDYAPRLWTARLGSGDPWSLDHRLAARADLQGSRTWRLGLTGGATRGTFDPLADPWSDFAPPGIVPSATPQPYESAQAGMELLVRAWPRLDIRAAPSASYSSGMTPEARVQLPRQRSASGRLSADYALDARDQVGLLSAGSITRTLPDGGYEQELAVIGGGLRWDRRLSPSVLGTLGGGTAWTRDATARPGTAPIEAWAPLAELGLTTGAERSRVTSRLRLTYAPDVDRVTGEVQQALTALGALTWLASPRWTWGASLSGTSVPDRDPAGWGTEAWGLRQLEGGLSLQVGFRYRWRRDTRTPQGSFDEAGAFLSVDWALARVRPPPAAPTSP